MRCTSFSTGAGESDIGAAEEALANHIGQKHRPDFGEGRPSQALVCGKEVQRIEHLIGQRVSEGSWTAATSS